MKFYVSIYRIDIGLVEVIGSSTYVIMCDEQGESKVWRPLNFQAYPYLYRVQSTLISFEMWI